ncbi:hypothetical protein PACTADRAFT_48531 [Pachysolen tannophilus NRRL Y-2460]|uniref:PIG-P domain-containing protein n=1 Tax=Pachysolen tannophilus NRRL Y-2460 TaxID=669874 RepID=A0A1E4TY76_PACTA|nr:hypothetical protein PACTADRAFT_48531 [Pachysolen tannophilus NRRL Y-2460]
MSLTEKETQEGSDAKDLVPDEDNHVDGNQSSTLRASSPLLPLSISTSSLTSFIPFYKLGTNRSLPSLSRRSPTPPGDANGSNNNVSDLLARESDVTVSTNITSQAEYKGFASYVISGLFLIIWLIWSILPDSYLNRLGVFYYPSRWWSVAIPSYIIMLMCYIYIALGLYNVEVKTVKLDDLRTIVDESGVIVTQLNSPDLDNIDFDDVSRYYSKSTSGIWDLPIVSVNRVLYSNED